MNKLIVANLKMNLSKDDVKKYKDSFKKDYKDNLIICPSYIYLDLMISDFYNIGSQNGYYLDCGAYTGEVSFKQLSEIGVRYSIIGHSERRIIFNESDELISKKVDGCIKNNIIPIICVGETLEERNSSKTFEIIENQLKRSLSGLKLNSIIIAYEPVWAIGSNKTPSKDEIEEVHMYIKKTIKDIYNIECRVLYGGSVCLYNSKDIININGVDGLLIGSASLDPTNLLNIISSTIV